MTGVKIYDPADGITYRHPGLTSEDRTDSRNTVTEEVVILPRGYAHTIPLMVVS